MPNRYYCDYCDTFLTHDSPSVRKTHCAGRKHKENVKFYYQKWMEDQAQSLIDATTAAFKAGNMTASKGVPSMPGIMPPVLPPGMPPVALAAAGRFPTPLIPPPSSGPPSIGRLPFPPPVGLPPGMGLPPPGMTGIPPPGTGILRAPPGVGLPPGFPGLLPQQQQQHRPPNQ